MRRRARLRRAGAKKVRLSRGRGQSNLQVGLTGSLASGKTTVLKFFQKQGWAVISADVAVSEIYKEKGLTKKKLREEYNTSRKLRKLERWVHPEEQDAGKAATQ